MDDIDDGLCYEVTILLQAIYVIKVFGSLYMILHVINTWYMI